MKLQTLNEAKAFAVQQCAIKKIDIDIYQAGNELKVKQSSLRNSPIYLNRAHYEKGNIIILDAKGQKIETIQLEPKQVAEKKETPTGKASSKKEGAE